MLLLKTMFKRRFIDLLKQTRAKVFMHTIRYLPHLGRKRLQLFYLLCMICMVSHKTSPFLNVELLCSYFV